MFLQISLGAKDTVDFGNVPLFCTATRPLALINNGQADLSLFVDLSTQQDLTLLDDNQNVVPLDARRFANVRVAAGKVWCCFFFLSFFFFLLNLVFWLFFFFYLRLGPCAFRFYRSKLPR